MPSTTNFNWTTPADTDLVKDGAAAIRTLGNGIDTSLVDLKGGTTGQILSKASNTDLDYTWIDNDQGDITGVTAGTGLTGGGTSGSVTLTNDMATTITASGDIVVGTGNGTYDNLPIGTTGQVLTADTTVSPYKVKWASVAAGGMTLIESGNLSGSSVVTGSIPNTYENLQLLIKNAQPATDGAVILIRLNGDTGTNYGGAGYTSVYNYTFDGSNRQVTEGIDNTAGNSITVLNFPDYANTTTWKFFTGFSAHKSHDTGTYDWIATGGLYNSTSAISTITIYPNNGNWSAGTYEVWGIK